MVVYSNRSNGNNQQRNTNDRIRCEVLEEIVKTMIRDKNVNAVYAKELMEKFS